MAAPQAEPILRHIRAMLMAGPSDPSTDAELLERFIRDGDESAYTALYRRYSRLVWSVLRRILESEQDREDAFQATFFLLARKANTIRRASSIGSWLYGVAYRIAMKAKKNAAKRERGHLARIPSGQDGRAPNPLPSAEVMSRELQALLDAEIMRLPEKYRSPFVLCCLETKSKTEAASELGWKEGTVSSRLARARRLLAHRLAERGVELGVVLGTLAVADVASALPNAFKVATLQAALAYGRGAQVASPVVAGLIQQISGGTKMLLLKTTALVLTAGLVAGSAGAIVHWQTNPDQGKDSPAQTDRRTDLKSVLLGQVTGRVINAADSRPVKGADVRLLPSETFSGEAPTIRRTSNDRGEFTFNNLKPGKYVLWAFHGNLTSRDRMYHGKVINVQATGVASAPRTKPVELLLHPGVSVKVKVLCQATGKPLVGARVRLIWTDTDRDHFTDAQGEVSLLALTAETYNVQASAEHCAAEVRIVNLGSGQPASLEFKLPPGGAVQGRITDKDGKPVAGVGVNVYGSADSGSPLDYVKTDAQGRYRFDNLNLDQTLKLYAHKLGYLANNSQFKIDKKESLHQHDVVIGKRPHGGSVSGIVKDPEGKPVDGATIHNQGGSSNEFRETKTDAQGKFLLDDVYADGIGYQLVVKAKGFAPERVEFKPGTAKAPASVEVQLKPGHRIKGRVVNSKGKPIPGVNVYYAGGNHHPGMNFGGSTTTDGQGRFQFDSLPPDVPFAFIADGYSEIPEMKLPLDGDEEVQVQMKAQGFIKGRVVDSATNQPIPKFNVRITFSPDRKPDDPGSGLLSSRVFPGEDFVSPQGRFLLKGFVDGMPLQVTASAPGYRRQVERRIVATSEPEASATGETLFKLTPEDPAKLTTVRGKLLNHKGQPVANAELRLVVATDRPAQRDAFPFNWQMIESGQIDQAPNVLQFQRLTTSTDGAFAFPGVPAEGELELIYWGKGIPPGRLDHLETLSAKDRANLEVKTEAPARVTGLIDRKIFPEFGSIQLSSAAAGGAGHFFQATISPDKKTFDIDDIPPGPYELQVYSTPIRLPDQPGAFQTKVIGKRSLNLKSGKVERVDLGKDDAVP
jgi:RNA polymerase sigma factor (sigma-70 family)